MSEKKEIPGTIKIVLKSDDTDTTEHVINSIRRMETNTSLYAAGSFAPLLVLLNQLPTILEKFSACEKTIALIAMGLFAASGLILISHRAFYSNLKRFQAELFRAGVKSETFKITKSSEHTLVAFESRFWALLCIVAFIAMPLGWLTMGAVIFMVMG